MIFSGKDMLIRGSKRVSLCIQFWKKASKLVPNGLTMIAKYLFAHIIYEKIRARWLWKFAYFICFYFQNVGKKFVKYDCEHKVLLWKVNTKNHNSGQSTLSIFRKNVNKQKTERVERDKN